MSFLAISHFKLNLLCVYSRDSNDLLWWAIIGNTEMYLSYKIEEDRSDYVKPYLPILYSNEFHMMLILSIRKFKV